MFDWSSLLKCGCLLFTCQTIDPHCSPQVPDKIVKPSIWTNHLLWTVTQAPRSRCLFQTQILRGGSSGGSRRKRGRKASSGAQSFRRFDQRADPGGVDPRKRQQGMAPPESDSESSEETPVPLPPSPILHAFTCHFKRRLKSGRPIVPHHLPSFKACVRGFMSARNPM
jgi:hypothetical protein